MKPTRYIGQKVLRIGFTGCLLFLVMVGLAQIAKEIPVNDNTTVSLSGYVEKYKADGPEKSATWVWTNAHFLPVTEPLQLTYGEESVYWIRFGLKNKTNHTKTYTLFFNPLWDNIKLYIKEKNNVTLPSARWLNFGNKQVFPGKIPAIKLHVPAQSTQYYLAEFKSKGKGILPNFFTAGCYPAQKTQTGIADNYRFMATYFKQIGQADLCINSYLKAQNDYQVNDDSLNLAETFEALGSFYYEPMRDFEKAAYYYAKSLALFKALNNHERINDLNSYLALAYWKLKKYDTALKKLNQALIWYTKTGNKFGIAYNHNALGMVYYDLGNYEKAETNFLIAQKINTEEGFTDLFSLQWNLFNIAKIKVKQGHFDEALTLLDSTSKLCEAKNFKEGMLENYELMAQAYTEQKNYQRATQMYQLIKNLNDSVFNLENTRKVTAAQSMFDAEKKELINRLKLEAEIKQHKWMLWVACLVILIVAGFSGLFFLQLQTKTGNPGFTQRNKCPTTGTITHC